MLKKQPYANTRWRFTNLSNTWITSSSLASNKPKDTFKCKQVVWVFKNINYKDFINLQINKKKGMLIGWQTVIKKFDHYREMSITGKNDIIIRGFINNKAIWRTYVIRN